jgi:hypothetical protein
VEAASALALSREPQAIDALKQCFADQADAALKTAILQSLAGSPQVSAAEFLLSVVEAGSSEHAALAVESLSKSRFRDEFRERVDDVARRRGTPAQGPLLS